MKNKKPSCCQPADHSSTLGKGILFGLLPHSFCLAFIVFSSFGVVSATSFFRGWLLNPYFFPILVIVSFALSLLSSGLYLWQNQSLSLSGLKNHSRYLTILIVSIVSINLLFFLVVFPIAANFSFKNTNNISQAGLLNLTLQIKIPCSGHAPLIIDELGKSPGVIDVKYRFPNYFDIKYSSETSAEKIFKLPIFKSFPAEKI